MRTSPSIVPHGADQDIYLVLDDFGGRLGCAWRETDEEHTGREALVRDLMDGQYSHPVRIAAFNTTEGWSRDASEEVALELVRKAAAEDREISETLQEFIETHLGRAIGVN
jgi:hypothetical protein